MIYSAVSRFLGGSGVESRGLQGSGEKLSDQLAIVRSDNRIGNWMAEEWIDFVA